MQKVDSHQVLFYFFLTAILIFGWFLQDSLLFNTDVSWLMHASASLLSGGSYSQNYFEINPPLILYLYIPPVLMMKWVGLSSYIALRVYIYLLGGVSLLLCAQCLKNLSSDKTFTSVFILVLAAIYFIMPIFEFGQREHLMLILTMPYFLLVACRLGDDSVISGSKALLVGLMAGLGFAIKPYFYAAMLLVEGYFILRKRTITAWMRPEVGAILGVILAYALIIILRHQDYITVIMPFISQFYYQSYGAPFRVILFNHHTWFAIFACSFFLFCARDSQRKNIYWVLMFAILGFLFSYLIQRTHWYYHIYPMFALSFLLIALLFVEMTNNKKIIFSKYRNMLFLSMALLGYLFAYLSQINQSAIFYPIVFFSLFFIIFAYLLYIAYQKNNIIKIAIILSLLFYAAFIFYQNVNMTIWHHSLFSLTTVMLFLLFAFFIPSGVARIKIKYLSFAFMGVIFFAFPFYQLAYQYAANLSYKNLYMGLVRDLQRYPNQSVLMLTDSGEFPFPALDYTHQPFASRFVCLLGLPVLPMHDNQQVYADAYLHNKLKMDMIANAVASDIQRYQPDLILVDAREFNKTKSIGYFGNNQMDYLRFFSLNANFKEQWKEYKYVETIDGQPLYRFSVYKK